MKLFGREPVLVYTFIMAAINLVAVISAWDPDDVQLGAINAFVAALLGVITRQAVTPVSDPRGENNVRLVPET